MTAAFWRLEQSMALLSQSISTRLTHLRVGDAEISCPEAFGVLAQNGFVYLLRVLGYLVPVVLFLYPLVSVFSEAVSVFFVSQHLGYAPSQGFSVVRVHLHARDIVIHDFPYAAPVA